MGVEEARLPESIRRRASVTPGGEYAWRKDDVEKVLVLARDAGLGCVGGQIQFQTSHGICEAYWVSYDSRERMSGEPWPEFVSRSIAEVIAGFRKICTDTDFRSVAREFDALRGPIDSGRYDPVADLWFVLYFMEETELSPTRPT